MSNQDGDTPLHHAIVQRNIQMIRFFTSSGSDKVLLNLG